MAYPEKNARYPGQDRAAKMCRAEGGGVPPLKPLADAFRDASTLSQKEGINQLRVDRADRSAEATAKRILDSSGIKR